MALQSLDFEFRKSSNFCNFFNRCVAGFHLFCNFMFSIGNILSNLRIDFRCEFLEHARYHDIVIPSIVMHLLISLKFFFCKPRYFGALRQTSVETARFMASLYEPPICISCLRHRASIIQILFQVSDCYFLLF